MVRACLPAGRSTNSATSAIGCEIIDYLSFSKGKYDFKLAQYIFPKSKRKGYLRGLLKWELISGFINSNKNREKWLQE
ncbi:MAG: hypothetical protein COB88_08210 [Flavobacteriales bacterium]|nr:MAG: hypothetical protein COB88_08210 [Flavobacteriales bacterium]